jgi:hypothetical protein
MYHWSPLTVSQTRRATMHVLVMLGQLIIGLVAIGYALLLIFMAYMIASTGLYDMIASTW